MIVTNCVCVFNSLVSLSFIWLIQRKPRTDLDLDDDIPSMHPRGLIDSDSGSYDQGNNGHSAISIISSGDIMDIPPTYEDALVNSKPINNWYKSQGTKAQTSHPSLCSNCSAKIKSKWSHVPATISECCNCVSSTSKSSRRVSTNHNKSPTRQKLSPSTASDHNYYSQYGSIEQTSTSRHETSEVSDSSSRKISYVQLDVDQLMLLSSSPPKYHELTFGQLDKQHNYHDTTINIIT